MRRLYMGHDDETDGCRFQRSTDNISSMEVSQHTHITLEQLVDRRKCVTAKPNRYLNAVSGPHLKQETQLLLRDRAM